MNSTSPAESYFSSGIAAAVRHKADFPGRIRLITAECLQYIATRDHAIRAMVHVDAQAALARADKLDAMLADDSTPLPLHGVPVIIKELYSVTGMPDSNGSRLATPQLFEPEGSLIKALRAAGCVILGKSLSIEFALGQFNLDRPMPVNPAAIPEQRATGGSSSGSAAALAAGYCPLTVGTDTGGSVRAPAALCGVVGFKPGEGSLPTDGIFSLSKQLDTPGFFTNCVADIVTVFAAVGGETDSGSTDPVGLCIGIPVGELFDSVAPAVKEACAAAIGILKNAGVSFVEIEMPSLATAAQYFATAIPTELVARLGKDCLAANQDLLDPVCLNRLAPFLRDAPENLAMVDLRAVRAAALQSLEHARVDCWLVPTVPCVAPLLTDLTTVAAVAEWQAYVSRNTRYTSMLGHAAISLPLPVEGLPVGIQLAAPADRNALLLQVAALLERLLTPR